MQQGHDEKDNTAMRVAWYRSGRSNKEYRAEVRPAGYCIITGVHLPADGRRSQGEALDAVSRVDRLPVAAFIPAETRAGGFSVEARAWAENSMAGFFLSVG